MSSTQVKKEENDDPSDAVIEHHDTAYDTGTDANTDSNIPKRKREDTEEDNLNQSSASSSSAPDSDSELASSSVTSTAGTQDQTTGETVSSQATDNFEAVPSASGLVVFQTRLRTWKAHCSSHPWQGNVFHGPVPQIRALKTACEYHGSTEARPVSGTFQLCNDAICLTCLTVVEEFGLLDCELDTLRRRKVPNDRNPRWKALEVYEREEVINLLYRKAVFLAGGTYIE
jgi:hypothetical protein